MITVGDAVKLKIPILENNIGTIGLCYEEYNLNPKCSLYGVSIIFENGEYDGFNWDEQNTMLIKIGYTGLNYKFINVMHLSQSFNNKYFSPYFAIAKTFKS